MGLGRRLAVTSCSLFWKVSVRWACNEGLFFFASSMAWSRLMAVAGFVGTVNR